MKKYLLYLSLLSVLLSCAQQTRPNTQTTKVAIPIEQKIESSTPIQQKTDSTAPSVLSAEGDAFLNEFQKAMSYLSNKSTDVMMRKHFATSFARHFAESAVIQIRKGDKIQNFRPIDYFNRLIIFSFEPIKGSFEVVKSTPIQKDAPNCWKKTYILQNSDIKMIDVYFFYHPSTKTWIRKYGHVLAHATQKLR